MPIDGSVCGLLLAGGQSRRMGGGDKCLRALVGKTLLMRVIDCARPQVDHLILNANGDPSRFEDYNLPVVGDVVDGFAGPLAGILTGMEWVRDNRPKCQWMASFACDAPFAPNDLVSRLYDAVRNEKGDLACGTSNGRDQPVFGLWPIELAEDLRTSLVEMDIRKVDIWTARHRLVRANWSTDPVDPFLNVNRPEDLAIAEEVILTDAASR
ncbi:MAG: molybdenum cofactor guanylyltransferase MobA [Alphaproteobacteria bacterium]|nr:molybdenum cofactor guanylyltransferase MobA [Alphaproteobacteria bacterium]